MFKFLRRLIIALVIVVVLLFLARNRIGAWIAEGVLHQFTGLNANIQHMDIRWNLTHLDARGITLLNPYEGFHERQAVNIERIEGDFDPLSVLRGRAHFHRISVVIPEIRIVRNSKGEFNLRQLRERSDPKDKQDLVQLDEFVLTLDKVTWHDEAETPSKPVAFEIKATKRLYKNVRNPDQVRSIVTGLVLKSLPANLLRLIPEGVTQGMKDFSRTIEEGVKSVGDFFGGGGDAEKPKAR